MYRGQPFEGDLEKCHKQKEIMALSDLATSLCRRQLNPVAVSLGRKGRLAKARTTVRLVEPAFAGDAFSLASSDRHNHHRSTHVPLHPCLANASCTLLGTDPYLSCSDVQCDSGPRGFAPSGLSRTQHSVFARARSSISGKRSPDYYSEM
jgi:hypothetical protein